MGVVLSGMHSKKEVKPLASSNVNNLPVTSDSGDWCDVCLLLLLDTLLSLIWSLVLSSAPAPDEGKQSVENRMALLLSCVQVNKAIQMQVTF